MEMNMFGKNLQFGPVRGYSLSHLGIAIRNSAGNMVSYDKAKGEIVDVDLIDFKADNLVYAIPAAIKDIVIGDVVLHNGTPMFVKGRDSNSILVIDVKNGEKKNILPTKSMFGFDFITKIVTLVDFSAAGASNDQPFGNLLPLMMLSSDNKSMKDMLPMMFLMNQGKGDFKFDLNNPLMLMAMMGGSEGKDFFPMYLLMTQSMTTEKKNCQCECHKEKSENQ
jgi:hypothetical protein